MIGHNAYSFDDVVAENLERGVLLAQRDCAARALRDPMLSQRHRVVLAEIILLANPRGVASPRRATLAERTGYTSSGIAKTVGELVEWGYVVSVRKSPAKGERALAHYAVVKPTIEELQQAITAHIDALRRGADVTPRGNVTPVGNVTPWGKVTPPDVTPTGNVTPGGNVTPAGNVTGGGNISQPDTRGGVRPDAAAPTSCIEDQVAQAVGMLGTEIAINNSNNLESTTTFHLDKPVAYTPAAKAKRGTRLAPDWRLPRSWGEWALEHFHTTPDAVRAEAANFRDYWVGSAPPAKATKVDWQATWRTWIRRRAWAQRKPETDAAPDLPLTVGSSSAEVRAIVGNLSAVTIAGDGDEMAEFKARLAERGGRT